MLYRLITKGSIAISLNEAVIQRVLSYNKDEGAIDEGFFGFFFGLEAKKKRPAGEAIEKYYIFKKIKRSAEAIPLCGTPSLPSVAFYGHVIPAKAGIHLAK